MEFSAVLALALATFIFVITPGPGIIAILARTMSTGVGLGLIMGVGLMSGDFIYLIAILASFHSLSDIVAPYIIAIRVIGACYLAYIGVMQWRAPVWTDQQTMPVKESHLSVVQTFLAGVAISATNPKVMIFYLSFLPAFVDLGMLTFADSVIVCITIAFALFMGVLIYAFGAHTLYRLIKDDKTAKRVNQITGSLIIGVAIVMVVTI
ncbi:MAG: LysE family translocator [Candidatus Puniceispirillaceae bacterium]